MSQTKEIMANLGNTLKVLFSFDTTGSMSACIADVRKKLRDLVEMLLQDIPEIQIGLIAHGDYCDGDNCINVLDFTNDTEKLINFINNTPNTSGGDAPECYELALHTARSLSWGEDGGAFVLIGDASPHEPTENPDQLNWKDELAGLVAQNVKVFPLQCMKHSYGYGSVEANTFWEHVSQASETPLLLLEDFDDSADTLAAVCYASAGSDKFDEFKTRSLNARSARPAKTRSKSIGGASRGVLRSGMVMPASFNFASTAESDCGASECFDMDASVESVADADVSYATNLDALTKYAKARKEK